MQYGNTRQWTPGHLHPINVHGLLDFGGAKGVGATSYRQVLRSSTDARDRLVLILGEAEKGPRH